MECPDCGYSKFTPHDDTVCIENLKRDSANLTSQLAESEERRLGTEEWRRKYKDQLADRDREIERLKADTGSYVDIVFDGPPGPESGRFVEVENTQGFSIRFGEWIQRNDGYWVLRINNDVTRLREDAERTHSQFFYDMAKWAAQKWEAEVRHRPSQNYLKAGLDSAWKGLEAYCLKRREEIDAARGEGE